MRKLVTPHLFTLFRQEQMKDRLLILFRNIQLPGTKSKLKTVFSFFYFKKMFRFLLFLVSRGGKYNQLFFRS